MKRFLLITGLFLAVAGIGVAQKTPPIKGAGEQRPAAPQPKDPAPQISDDYVIGVEDILSVNVYKEPDFTLPQTVVLPDGMITIPLIGDVKANGLTKKQLQDSISEKLKLYLQDPAVTVAVLKAESHRVSIIGQVGRPGTYPLGAPMTVMELIARAGGLSEYAKAKDIKIVRNGKILLFNYKEVINGKNLKQNIFLQNGDMVMVPG